MSLLNVSGLSFRYPSTVELFRDATFAIDPGDCLAVVGPNGAGKSTLLRILAGELEPSAGAIARRRSLRLEHAAQAGAAGARVLFDFVFEARPALARIRVRLVELETRLGEHAAEYAELVNEYEAQRGYAAEADTGRVLDGLGFLPGEWSLSLENLSGGQRVRAALARALHAEADLLLLDEPTNHLDIAAREWLEQQLAGRVGACVVVSHDRTLLRHAATRVLEIERGGVTLFDGGYDDYRDRRALRERQAWENWDAFQRRKAAAEQASERRAKLAVRVGTPPPDVRSGHDFYGRKASKVARTARLLRERAARGPEVQKPWEEQPIPELDFGHVARSGDIALSVTRLSKRYGDKRLIEAATFHLARGERMAVVGPNGSGKTTLLRLILGAEVPDEGTVRLGANVVPGYFAQDAGDLDKTATPLAVCGAGTLARTLLACLKVRPDRIDQPIGQASAGERAKIALVRLLLSGANLLLLDEPTEHLEIEAQEALEAALAQYPGTLVVVSHDRSFLEGVGITRRWSTSDGAGPRSAPC